MAVFPSDSIRTKDWGSEVLTDSDLETQFDLLHSYFQACLNATTGHAHTGASNQGPKISPANLLIASQATGDLLYASSATAWARLAKGTTSQVLVGGDTPSWGAVPAAAIPTASSAEVKTGTEAAKYVSPSTMIGHEGVAKGWILMNGTGTISIKDSYNVSGIVDNGTADYTITWDTDFGSAYYAVAGTAYNDNNNTFTIIEFCAQDAGSLQIIPRKQNGSSTYTQDIENFSILAIGDR